MRAGPSIVVAYAVSFWIALVGIGFLYGAHAFPTPQPGLGASRTLADRALYYQKHADEFDVLFLGDSRTYCGVHAELVDRLLGTHGLNLASFSNWLPTQHALVRDIVPFVPPGTMVVWLLGHENFVPNQSIQRVYPIHFSNAARYLAWGVHDLGLLDNVMYYSWPLYFFAERGQLRGDVLRWLEQPIPSPEVAATVSTQAEDDALRAHYAGDPDIENFAVIRDGGRVNSVVLYFRRGGYYRIEIEPSYFRDKQHEMDNGPLSDAEAATFQVPEPGGAEWRLFRETLELFARGGVRLIVSEFEEAPFIYRHPMVRERWRAFMRERVEAAVLAHGFPYVRVDFDGLEDADYFDYNHLNSRGITKFTPLLADALRSVLAPRPDEIGG